MFKSLSNFNFRIIRKLILEKYLWEEIKVSDMGIVSAYVKPGPKVGQAKTSKFTLDIQKNTKEAVVKESSSTDNLNNDNVLKTIEEDCFVELKNSVARAFPDLKSVYLAIPIECFREIAEKLPTSKPELQEIEQMTHLRVEKFGAHLLTVCKDFNTKRLNYLGKIGLFRKFIYYFFIFLGSLKRFREIKFAPFLCT